MVLIHHQPQRGDEPAPCGYPVVMMIFTATPMNPSLFLYCNRCSESQDAGFKLNALAWFLSPLHVCTLSFLSPFRNIQKLRPLVGRHQTSSKRQREIFPREDAVCSRAWRVHWPTAFVSLNVHLPVEFTRISSSEVLEGNLRYYKHLLL